ncbi:hypothetical protein AMAG_17577 [Allomyces macrogynus ATCC 38327]|uniref:Uncharacterized protein n=1 Tax=Allomyces macrogynus (strain ATCC 38327) TaxID=578462 RepID=A0A0L0TFD4_ALLM3|nr:hypothetical protein AMAG_17577 [Allomyces macrogynus ATCC 38327]|eukprot:KNE73386.1 hypothetical protein AMAG_17577 [Allomyces macrogynus ATCC 38327]
MSKKDALADRSFLGKPIPKPKKYSNVGPTIDSGASEANFLRHQFVDLVKELIERSLTV